MEAFVAIAQLGNFVRASAHLNLSQDALSHRIRKLEDDIGTRLLLRTTRGPHAMSLRVHKANVLRASDGLFWKRCAASQPFTQMSHMMRCWSTRWRPFWCANPKSTM
jgi:hypothetical protein